VISAKSGGTVEIPNLTCKTYEEAQFLLDNLGLKIGEVIQEGDISDLNTAYIISQQPTADGSLIEMESAVQLRVVQNKPASCN
jgi:beta-lactam-binding protein with PASTA domain